jgi:hypothetical protein
MGISNPADTTTSIGSVTGASASTVYDGGGTTNALQVAVTETALVALGTQPAEILLSEPVSKIRLFMANTTASQSCSICIGQFDDSDNLLDVTEQDIPITDQTFDTDQDAWGLDTGTDIGAKQPLTVLFKRNTGVSYLKVWVSISLGGTWYTRYQLG